MITMIYWHPALAATVVRVLEGLPALHLAGWLADPPIPHPLFPLAIAAAGGGGGDASTITQFFKNLYDNGIKPVAYAVALFFFAWGAISLMFPHERSQDHAKAALYRAGRAGPRVARNGHLVHHQ
ncbi:hypothetical protein [Ktedonobacter robiniae]|uniref:Major facilitator superfamily (MFS) profile domain-containing protein n=1 Tax=Ktedonobacter robiniae TaxID=2778365 RepID=A0ABQ3UUP3_9CHLR|nr:hypothetical protein [Ktedonobacter robiniae]GHO56312.1 hypothetical protein KSB_47870 [Ktedonobacter robiniae]